MPQHHARYVLGWTHLLPTGYQVVANLVTQAIRGVTPALVSQRGT